MNQNQSSNYDFIPLKNDDYIDYGRIPIYLAYKPAVTTVLYVFETESFKSPLPPVQIEKNLVIWCSSMFDVRMPYLLVIWKLVWKVSCHFLIVWQV
jgi:hypothetical protein